MPWDIRREGRQHCVYKTDTNEKLKCYPSRAEALKYQRALSWGASKSEKLQHVMLEGVGPAILGVAVTNRPHLPLPPISIVGEGESKRLRVPFLRAGIYKHPQGQLVFNDAVFDRMIENHNGGAVHYGVSLDMRHKPELGALAWFSTDKGGDIKREDDPKYGRLLVGYGVPVDEEAEKLVTSGKYRYASVEFATNYESSLVSALSNDELTEITLEDLEQEVNNMEYPIKNDDGTVVISLEMFDNYESAKQSVKALQEKAAKLEAQLKANPQPDPEPALPEPVVKRLEEQAAQLAEMKMQLIGAQVDTVIERARARVADGRAHSPVLLEWASAVMRGQPLANTTIKLEESNTTKYVVDAISWLLENVPGQVPIESHTEPEDTKPASTKFDKEDYESFWNQ